MTLSITIATLVLLSCPFTTLCQEPLKKRTLGHATLTPIQDAARDLSREVEFLEEDIVSELTGTKERNLFNQTDTLLMSVESFRRLLKAETPRDEIDKSFDRVDEQLRTLMTDVASIAKENKVMQRAGNRVGRAGDQLHSVLFTNEAAEDRAAQTLERHARAMASAAARLDRAAEVSLAGLQGRAVLIADLKKLADASQAFQKSVERKATRDVLCDEFSKVTLAWQRVAEGFQDLKVNESVYLIHNAAQIDRLHHSLFRIVGGKGDRPQLILRT